MHFCITEIQLATKITLSIHVVHCLSYHLLDTSMNDAVDLIGLMILRITSR